MKLDIPGVGEINTNRVARDLRVAGRPDDDIVIRHMAKLILQDQAQRSTGVAASLLASHEAMENRLKKAESRLKEFGTVPPLFLERLRMACETQSDWRDRVGADFEHAIDLILANLPKPKSKFPPLAGLIQAVANIADGALEISLLCDDGEPCLLRVPPGLKNPIKRAFLINARVRLSRDNERSIDAVDLGLGDVDELAKPMRGIVEGRIDAVRRDPAADRRMLSGIQVNQTEYPIARVCRVDQAIHWDSTVRLHLDDEGKVERIEVIS